MNKYEVKRQNYSMSVLTATILGGIAVAALTPLIETGIRKLKRLNNSAYENLSKSDKDRINYYESRFDELNDELEEVDPDKINEARVISSKIVRIVSSYNNFIVQLVTSGKISKNDLYKFELSVPTKVQEFLEKEG